jgi:hypothetical protein
MFTHRLPAIVLATCCAALITGCTIPSSSATHVSVSGQVFSTGGEPLVGKRIELILPAEYGLSELDTSHGRPEEFGHQAQRVVVVTDSLGSFSYSFAPVTYTTPFWFLPPMGTLFKHPPEPFFVLRFAENSDYDESYSVLVKEKDTVYAIRRDPQSSRLSKVTPKSVEITGKLYPDKRGETCGWIADIRLKRLLDTSRGALATGEGQ